MLLRKSISNTKKFFQKTVHNFKALFSFSHADQSPTYNKLPKSSPYYVPYNSFGIDMDVAQTGADYQELERFYSDFKYQWDKNKGRKMKSFKNWPVPTEHEQVSPKPEFSPVKDSKFPVCDSSLYEQRSIQVAGERQGDSGSSKAGGESKSLMVAEKLKELEMIDRSNIDHVLDIEEVLHYYSRLTCPFYVDIIDKFFMEVVAEFSGPDAVPTPGSANSRPKFGPVREQSSACMIGFN